MTFKVGDRYEWVSLNTPSQASLIEFISDKEFVILEGVSKGETILDPDAWNFRSKSLWKYLGNFAKDTSFITLYNILNGE